MSNQELLEKLKEDMEMRGFSHYTKDSYYRKAKDIIKYFNKPMEEVTTKELREFLMKYLREKKKVSERSSNYYNSVIRFIYDVVLDIPINHKQIPMYRKKRKLPKILSEEELKVFFNACENYQYKTIFMMIYGSGLRISEATNIRVEDIDSKNMRLFVRNGKGERERYTVLPEASLEMLRKCYKMYKPKHKDGYMFLNREGNPLKVERLRVFFRRYRRKAGINDSFIVHSLRHSFATKLVEEGVPLVCDYNTDKVSEVKNININKNVFGEYGSEDWKILVTPSTTDHLIHVNYEGPKTFSGMYYYDESTGELDSTRPFTNGYVAYDSDGNIRYYDTSGALVLVVYRS